MCAGSFLPLLILVGQVIIDLVTFQFWCKDLFSFIFCSFFRQSDQVTNQFHTNSGHLKEICQQADISSHSSGQTELH